MKSKAFFFSKKMTFFLHFPSARLAGQVRPIAISRSWCSRRARFLIASFG